MNVVGHENVINRFAQWVRMNRLANTYLLAGPEGIGKRMVAMRLAKGLLCEGTASDDITPCGSCPACQQVDAMTHPDLLLVQRPAEKNVIPIDLLIGSGDKRMREGLCHDISLKPFRGGRRIAILDDADFLNQEGANCLLKTLEEPPPSAVIFLISSSEHRQLQTIRSRSQIIRFQALTPAQIERVLLEQELLEDPSIAGNLASACSGSLQLALQLADRETFDFRNALLQRLASLDPGADDFATTASSFIDSAGKDSAAKRDRFRLVALLASQFYRNVMVALCNQPINGDKAMQIAVQEAVNRWPGDAESAASCIERCETVRQHIAANANQVLNLETWLCELGRIVRGEMLV